MKTKRSNSLFKQAQDSIPGGVNSPARAFKAVGGNPLFIKSAKGAYIYDEDNNSYIDYINSWGAMILGHAHENVVAAVQEQVNKGLSFGTPTEMEVQMAELVAEIVPGIDKVRMVNSGTEACMTAIRIARAYSKREKIIKFEGCYHGHSDSFLIKAGSGAATLGAPSSPGVTVGTARDTLNAKYNDIESVEKLFNAYPGEIACVIAEPIGGNMGCVPPEEGFLKSLKSLCEKNGALFILDEVMTGFRVALGGAQELYGITADISCFGKVIGGGLPVGAIAGKKHIMDLLSPIGNVYQAGTLSGNPLAMCGGYHTLKELSIHPNIYIEIDKAADRLQTEISSILKRKGVPFHINRVGSMFTLFFTDEKVTNFDSAQKGDNETFKTFFHAMLDNGVYLPPSCYECWFVSHAIEQLEIEKTIEAVESAFA